MSTRRLTFRWGFAAAVGAAILTLAALYFGGNPAVSNGFCELRLPNLSIPRRFRNAVHERCVLYGPRTRFQGILWSSGFESSGFFPHRFAEEAFARRGDITYQAIALEVDDKSDPDRMVERAWGEPFEGGKLLVTFYGWPSRSEGRFGHLGGHDQQILVDRFTGVAPAPEPAEADYARWRRMLATSR